MHQQFNQAFLDLASDILYANGLLCRPSLGIFENEPAILLECFDRGNAFHTPIKGRVKISTLLLNRLGWSGWIVPTVEGKQFCSAWRCEEEANQQQS